MQEYFYSISNFQMFTIFVIKKVKNQKFGKNYFKEIIYCSIKKNKLNPLFRYKLKHFKKNIIEKIKKKLRIF